MSLPDSRRLELPILLELKATGGRDQLRFLYSRLVSYFPQLSREDLADETSDGRSKWKRAVQRAGRALSDKGELKRSARYWELTAKGRRRAEEETLRLAVAPAAEIAQSASHEEAQRKLVEIGRMLGKYSEAEFQRYDVVWRDSRSAPRISHVFEVQVKGKIESALAKLKHAYDTQRSRPFLIIADERNSRRARRFLTPYLSGSFHEIGHETVVLGIGDLDRLYHALKSVEPLLEKIF